MVRRGAAWALILLVIVISMMSGSVGAQSNLLQNPGFEGGFAAVAAGEVAANWTPWNAPRTAEMPSYQNGQPVYLAASNAGAQGVFSRTRTGSNAQIYYSFYETHDGGLYQQVSGITPGTELRFSIYGYVWSSKFDDVNVSDEPGDVALRVGIDPTGGTDPFASSVVYTDAQVFYDAFRQYSVTATAQASTVTVFVRSTVGEPVQGSYIYLDDAVLEGTATGGPVTTAAPTTVVVVGTDTPAPTNTPVVPTNTVTSSPVPASNTPNPASTIVVIVATDTKAAPGQATPTAETGLPTATPVPPTATTRPSTGGPNPIPEEFPGTIVYVVRSGDVVFNLARTYGSSVNAIIAANGLNSNGFIRQGQSLVIPVRIVPVPATQSPLNPTATLAPGGTGGPVGTTTYVVQPGDSLTAIAQRYRTTLNGLAQLNGISNPNRIFVGQRLIVPASGTGGPVVVPTSPGPVVVITVPVIITATPVGGNPAPRPNSYLVQRGDTLYLIATRFNVSMIELARINNITNYNLVFAGSTLVIPQ
jgi:LysM repeat protein